MKFKKFFENIIDIDSSQIEVVYDKAKIAVNLVKKYKPDLLKNVSVIANLTSGAYGVYTHFKVKGKNVSASGIVYDGEEKKIELNQLPQQLLHQKFPNVNPNKLQKGDVVKVNINRILNDPRIKTDFETVKQIALTIVHESKHKQEVDETGKTSESGPMQAEREFLMILEKPEVSEEIKRELIKFPKTSRTVGTLF
jgi:uncharacterized protein YicC (UPF0701 family)